MIISLFAKTVYTLPLCSNPTAVAIMPLPSLRVITRRTYASVRTVRFERSKAGMR